MLFRSNDDASSTLWDDFIVQFDRLDRGNLEKIFYFSIMVFTLPFLVVYFYSDFNFASWLSFWFSSVLLRTRVTWFITALAKRDSASFLEFGTLSRSWCRKIQFVSGEIVSNKKIEAIDNTFGTRRDTKRNDIPLANHRLPTGRDPTLGSIVLSCSSAIFWIRFRDKK